MKVFMNTEVGKGIQGIMVSIGIMMAAFIPILMMEIFSKFFHVS